LSRICELVTAMVENCVTCEDAKTVSAVTKLILELCRETVES
jgi:hypothetical protein